MEFWKPEIIWCLLGIIMLFAEFAMPGFVILFFGVGALLVAFLLLFFNLTLNVQIILFLVLSVLSLGLLRKWLKTIFKGILTGKNSMPKNSESFVGERAVVDSDISAGVIGKVEFHGTLWNAVSDVPITKGTLVVITKQNNLTFEVKPQTTQPKGDK